MSRSHRLTLAVAGLLGLGAVTSAQAQIVASANVNATAFVQGIAPLTAQGVSDLNFGTVNAGTPKSILNAAADGGRWTIAGEPSRPVTVTFTTLPTQLTGPGGNIPIAFGGADGLHWTTFPTVSSPFNPNGSFLTALDVSGNLVIGITGTVSPPLGTTTGTYTGVITLQVAY